MVYIDLFSNSKSLKVSTIHSSNKYFAEYGANYLVEKLSWSAEHILNTCDNSLKCKVQEGLVGALSLEASGSLVLKLMIDIIFDMDDSDLCVLIKSL